MTATGSRRSVPPRSEGPSGTVFVSFTHLDWFLIVPVVLLAAAGVGLVYSATHRALEAAGDDPAFFAERQVTFVAIGLGAMLVAAFVDHRALRDRAGLFYVAAVASLVGVLLVGVENNGARAWYSFGGFQVQPSEFGKLVLIIILAAYLGQAGGEVDITHFLVSLGVAAVPMVLVLAQPDLGTTLVYMAIVMGVLLVGGGQLRHIAVATGLGVAAVSFVLVVDLLPPAQSARLTAFFNDDAPPALTYNADQALIAIGAGGLTGQGWLEGTQTRLDFVPEQHTDFIFTAAAEQFGFFGSAVIVALYALILWRLWRISVLARELSGTLITLGVFSMLLFHVFQNIGMNVGIMPITGIPLPFLSYGGSSTIVAFTAVGMALNVHLRRFR